MAAQETQASDKTKERGRHQIGEVADRLGLSIRTIRHYDEEGLVKPSARTVGGFRLYGEEDIERLALIKRMKPLGFSLDEMRELLAARDRLAATDGEAEDALDRLSRFAAAAKEKCAALRRQLEMAEEFAGQIEAEQRRYREVRSTAPRARPTAGR